MLVPPVCLHCGCSIGDKADIFIRIRHERLKTLLAKEGTMPEKAATNLKLSMDMSDLMDKLGVRADCCRTHLATAMRLVDYY